MKIKTSELTGEALDWAVLSLDCKLPADFASIPVIVNGKTQIFRRDTQQYSGVVSPTTDWRYGGPIVERERITLRVDTRGGRWVAFLDGDHVTARMTGATPLIAAMRCYVASKLGTEVEIPSKLTQGETQ